MQTAREALGDESADTAGQPAGTGVEGESGLDEVSQIVAAGRNETRGGVWGPLQEPNGLVLVRHQIVRSDVSKKDEPAVTPSALRASKATDWIELIVRYEDDGGPYEGRIELEFADGRKEVVRVAKHGLHIRNVLPGTVKVTLPEMDERAWTV